MTIVGSGGVVISGIEYLTSFTRSYKKLSPELQNLTKQKIKQLLQEIRPAGLRFEKLQGYRRPDIYTVHVTGNYKMSFEVKNSIAFLRKVGVHNKIDRAP